MYWILFGAVCALFALAVYARWRMLREERRPGYIYDQERDLHARMHRDWKGGAK